jgi:hypothetical protein
MVGIRLVVLGRMGQAPFAGLAWQVLHYLEGFRRLGCDVFYLEDTGEWPYDPVQNAVTADAGYTVDYLGRVLGRIGMQGRWAYRHAPAGGLLHGVSEPQLAGILRATDVLVNLTGGTVLREEHLHIPERVYLETDPVLPQVEVATGRQFTIDLLASHTRWFTFGENIGSPGCPVPVGPFDYRPTRQPVVLDWWATPADTRADGAFTTVASWEQAGKDVIWHDTLYTWSKHHEFRKLIDLPMNTAVPLELALACDDEPTLAMLRAHGWLVVDALRLSRDPGPYRDYLRRSAGEFTVAKDQNIRLRSGWFSDRSACYLAAGRPVVTQDTGFGEVLPTGAGLFAFRSGPDALAALEAIRSAPGRHAAAAREVAREYFASDRVLGHLLDEALASC